MAHAADFSAFPVIGAESRWFTVWQIAPNVKAIFEPHHFQEVISYLIEGETGAVLFDSGMGIGNMRALVESLTDKPITLVCSHATSTMSAGHGSSTARISSALPIPLPRRLRAFHSRRTMRTVPLRPSPLSVRCGSTPRPSA